jgi:hypothetical protein
MSQLPFSDTKMRRCCWPGSKLFFKYASNTFRFFGVQQLHRSPRTLPFLAFPFSTSWTFQAVTLRRYSAPGRTNSTWDIHYRFWIPKWSFFSKFYPIFGVEWDASGLRLSFIGDPSTLRLFGSTGLDHPACDWLPIHTRLIVTTTEFSFQTSLSLSNTARITHR